MGHDHPKTELPAAKGRMRTGARTPKSKGGAHELTSADRQAMIRAGAWIKALRLDAGLSQKEMQARLGVKSPVFCSQIENGSARLQPQHYEVWGRAVGLSPKEVARMIIGFYTPFLYEPLFGEPFQPPN